jgi:hypothetical protein
MMMSWYSPFSKVTGYGLDDEGPVPGRGKDFVFATTSRPAVGPTQHPVCGYQS